MAGKKNLLDEEFSNLQSEKKIKLNGYDVNKCRIIAFFSDNCKFFIDLFFKINIFICIFLLAGVGKTNIIFNLAYMFAEIGKRVLVIDCDSERKLSMMMLKSHVDVINNRIAKHYEDENSSILYENPLTTVINTHVSIYPHRTLYDQIVDNGPLNPAQVINIARNIMLLPGHKDTNTLDELISNHEIRSSGLKLSNDKTGKIYASIMQTAKLFEIDYVFLDLSSNKGVLNKRLVFSSHYFILVASPDPESSECINSMHDYLQEWAKEKKLVEENMFQPINFPLSPFYPKFMGVIINNISPCGEETIYHKKEVPWIRQIKLGSEKIANLDSPLALAKQSYEKISKKKKILGEIRNFFGLQNLANKLNVPVHSLKEKDMIGTTYKARGRENEFLEKVDRLKKVFHDISSNIIQLAEAMD